MSDVTIHWLSHIPERLMAIPQFISGSRILLGSLKINPPEWQDNRLGEGRFFLADIDIPNTSYIGQLNARLPIKYRWADLNWTNLSDRLNQAIGTGRVVAPWTTERSAAALTDWIIHTDACHPGSRQILEELPEATGLPMCLGPSLWANDFICERAVWLDFREVFRRAVQYFANKYGHPANVPFPSITKTGEHTLDSARTAAYLYERVTTLYFATRTDLNVVGL